MYESFSQPALRLMQLANMEGQRLNHEWLSREHLLLAFTNHEDTGIDAALRVPIRENLDARLTPGPDMIVMGKLPLSEHVRSIVQIAMRLAKGDNATNPTVTLDYLWDALLLDCQDGPAYECIKQFNLRA